ncbi:non-ribosomal peptide synthetase [Nocardia cyriacigeorgica]|uniref:Non-ribosomal peptide synthetase n=1 Tax=Nocardia cyriacigeorgica TaxID=135487 RepID=A0ABX0CIN6_9NOCA|nr:condensation domain-containing protein [Nocardia cyriacigeorgica]NEW56408.1 non-ribosomal peptide synthetase [Nocardia cyriacigeorgica]
MDSASGILAGGIGNDRFGTGPLRVVGRAMAPVARPPVLMRRPRPDHLPLAPAQERMWHAARIGRSAEWNVSRAVRIRGGSADLDALLAAIGDVVARHEPLRTCYPATEHGPAQVVVPFADVEVDVRVCTVGEHDLAARLAEFAQREFDLANDLPLRARVYVLGADDVVLLLVGHHISIDGRSLAPLLRDLGAAYTARARGLPPVLAPLPIDYADYTLWKHAQLGDFADESSRAIQQLRYWANTLAGRRALLEFPVDRPRQVVSSSEGAIIPVCFPVPVHAALLDRAQHGRASLFMVLQAAFALCVGWFGRSADVTVATAVSGRDHRLLDDLVGNFADDVLLRVRLDRAADMDELIDQVRRVALAAFAHPDTPNPRLKRCLLQDAACPLFQATLILERGTLAPGATTGPAPTVTDIPTGALRAKHDLEFGLTERYDDAGMPGGVDGVFLYPTALFDPDTAEAFVGRFTAVVRALAAGYRGPLTALPALR